MKNNSSDNLEAKVVERSERAKKLYRYVSDVARRVGEATTASRSILSLFSTNIEVQRQKLRDNCEKLIFLEPLDYGKKSLELLWRKVYYETVAAAKKLRETDSDNESSLFTHIICGIGHFQHLIERFQLEFKLQNKDLDYVPTRRDEFEEVTEGIGDDVVQFGRTALHSCLIYLGDLCRYEVELFHTFDPSIAARYYLQAVNIDMSSGMPYNQIGNLYLDKNYNLDSTCYYIQCLSCETPFDGALGNLTKIFERNTQFYDTINESESLTQAEHIQNTIVNFLSLIEIWFNGKNDTNIPQRCNTIAHQLKTAMDFTKTPLPDINKNYEEYVQAVADEGTGPSYMNGNLVHKIVQICLFTIPKITEIDETKAFACKAFTLALLSQLLQKMRKQLQVIGLQNPADKYRRPSRTLIEKVEKVDTAVEMVNETEKPVEVIENGKKSQEDLTNENEITEESEKLQNGNVKNAKKPLAKRRRRRRCASSESSGLSDAETESSETFESCSDEEESESSIESEEDSQSDDLYDDSETEVIENDKEDIKENDVINTNNNTIVNGIIKNDDNKAGKEGNKNTEINNKTNELTIAELQNFLLGDNFLPSIKLLQDWVLTEKDLILSCGDSGESLFQCLVDLLNIFTFYFDPNTNEDENEHELLKYIRNIAQKLSLEYKTIPLPEDINLRSTNICKFDKNAAEWQILDRYKPSMYEENVIRILNFIDFGNQIAKIVPRIRFNRSMKIFYLKKIPPPKLSTKINHKRSREWHNSKKQHVEPGEGGLLRRLGRLWLASQVRELERSGRTAAPALLALDSAALNKHLRRVKQLARAKNFVLLVPTVVLQELDNLKREQSTARDAIRWLELQLKSGSRFLRAQRPGQSKPLPLLKYPRKAPPHVHNFIQILEFCNHFVSEDKSQGGNGDSESLQGKSTSLLKLLVGNEPGTEEEQYKEFSLTGAAQSAGISVEYIGDFYLKWRHKNGKKR